MSRPVAVLKKQDDIEKFAPLLALGANIARGAMAAGRMAGGAAKVAGKGIAAGAKKIGNVAQQGIKAVGESKVGEIAANKVADKKQLAVGVANLQQQRAQMKQQQQQNQMSTAQGMADKAKADATVQKAFNFLNYLEQEEYEPFMKKVLALADTLPRTSENPHYNERIGLMGEEHDNARYTNDQTFKYKGRDTGLTITQVMHALHEIYQQQNPDNRDRLVFSDMITTDEPHPRPAGMGNANAKLVQVVTDPKAKDVHITAGQTLTQAPEGVSQKTITPQGFFEQKNMLDMGIPTQSNQGGSQEFLQQFYGGGKKNFQDVEDLVNRFSTREEDKLTGQLAAQDKVQEGRDYIAEQNYNKKIQQEEAENQRTIEEETKEQAFQEQPVEVKQMGGMYFVTDPAYGYNQSMMDYQQLIEGGYDKYLKSNPFDLAWQMLFKESVELHHDEELPSEFVNDVMMLDRTHKMTPTNNGTLIDNIDPFMHRTIELMAQNFKEENPVEEKPQSMMFY